MLKNRRIAATVTGLILFVAVSGLAEFFPGLKPYLPDIRGTFEKLTGNESAGPIEAQAQTARPSDKNRAKPQAAVLALSWTAAFCETKPDKRECKSQREGRYDADKFALHGLWPAEQYCSRTPYKNVPEKLWKAMQVAMPGTQSGLHRHEWEKHGTCYSDNPVIYYTDAIRLTLAMNQTAIRDLFADNIGKQVSAAEIRATFDKTFGKGAGDRVLVHCVRDGNRQLIQELRIALNGDMRSANFPVLLKQARAQKRGCKGGLIDPVGLQ